MNTQHVDRCSVCGAPYEDTGKKQQCRNCGMFANLCCDPQMPTEFCARTVTTEVETGPMLQRPLP